MPFEEEFGDTPQRWDLEGVCPEDGIDALFDSVSNRIDEFSRWQEKLIPKVDETVFQDYVAFSEALLADLNRTKDLGFLLESEDAESDRAGVLKSRAELLVQKYSDAKEPLRQWIQGREVSGMPTLDDKNAKRLFASVPLLQDVFRRERKNAKHSLGLEAEQVLSAQKAVVDAHSDVRDSVVLGQRYFFKPAGEKRGKTLKTEAQVRSLYNDKDPKIREAAYRAVFGGYEPNFEPIFRIYQAVVKGWGAEAKLRGFNTPISMRNHRNSVSDKAIGTLMEVAETNRGIFQRYFRWKAEELGLGKLTRFDIYAPIHNGKKEESIPFGRAVDEVLEMFGDFSPRFREYALRMVTEGRIDSHPRKRKRGGAFCSEPGPGELPYVLLNHTGDSESSETLAHELGHAIHDIFAWAQSTSGSHPPLPLAETASILAENLLFERRLGRAEGVDERKALLARKLAKTYATIPRQIGFVKFEMQAHDAIARGTTREELNDIYFRTLTEQFSNSVEIDPMFANEWTTIPHIFHAPFYCYAYPFGDLFSSALHQRYRQDKEFKGDIETLLTRGGSLEPRLALQEIGIDVESSEFWQGSFDYLAEQQTELERLSIR